MSLCGAYLTRTVELKRRECTRYGCWQEARNSCHQTASDKFTLEQAMQPGGEVIVQLYSFVNRGTKWGWVANATSRPLYPRDDPAPGFVRLEAYTVFGGPFIKKNYEFKIEHENVYLFRALPGPWKRLVPIEGPWGLSFISFKVNPSLSSTHCTEGWVCPRAGLDRCRNSRPHKDSIPRS